MVPLLQNIYPMWIAAAKLVKSKAAIMLSNRFLWFTVSFMCDIILSSLQNIHPLADGSGQARSQGLFSPPFSLQEYCKTFFVICGVKIQCKRSERFDGHWYIFTPRQKLYLSSRKNLFSWRID